jgi:hypothetical protein
VRARAPVPEPHSPAPGRSVSTKVATTKPRSARSVASRRAPQGSASLKKRTARWVRRAIRGVPLETPAGSAK